MSHRAAAGFTLIELTVALGVFAVLSVLAYGGLSQVLEARRQVESAAERLTGLQLALTEIGRDVREAVPRRVRDARGDPEPPLRADAGEDLLSLTTASWPNPAGLPRSNLRRVAYRARGGTLERVAWPVLDRAPDTDPRVEALAPGVRRVAFRFLDGDRLWHEQWPPATGRGSGSALPLAVEVTLELEDWGPVQRLFALPG